MSKKHVTLIALFLLVVLAGCSQKEKPKSDEAANKPETPQALERQISGDKWFGCAKKENFLKFSTAKDKETKEYKKAFASAIINKECKSLKDGDIVVITDSTSQPGAIRVKPKNGLFEFWTSKEAVK
jgi:PBP1b-binding outer membrane lipoprotein LpoB